MKTTFYHIIIGPGSLKEVEPQVSEELQSLQQDGNIIKGLKYRTLNNRVFAVITYTHQYK